MGCGGCDEQGIGYYANCNPNPRWGAGVRFPSNAACYDACVRSGDAGCGPCSYISPCLPEPIIEPLPPTIITEPPIVLPHDPLIDDKKGIDPKVIIITVIAFILLSRS